MNLKRDIVCINKYKMEKFRLIFERMSVEMKMGWMGPLSLIFHYHDLVTPHSIGNSMIEIFKEGGIINVKIGSARVQDLGTNRATKKRKYKQTMELKVCCIGDDRCVSHIWSWKMGTLMTLSRRVSTQWH